MNIADHFRRTIWARYGLLGHLEFAALYPLSLVFGVGVGLRNFAYRTGMLRTQKPPIPVISVGNLAVGGTGKTPFTLWLSKQLTARGLRVAIVMRGYGGKLKGVTVVSNGEGPRFSAAEAGDEAVMLARSSSGPVITSPRRIDGIAMAAELGCDAVLLDDGFQHRSVARAVDLVLVDMRHRTLLPAGPMRERRAALKRADAVLLVDRGEQERHRFKLPRGARTKPLFSMRVEPSLLVELVGKKWNTRPVGYLAGKKIAAVSGIGQPESFYEFIRQWDGELAEIYEFEDHHEYTMVEWQRIARRAQWVDIVVTTEKDLVKLEAFPFATEKLFALRIEPRIDREDELIEMVLTKCGFRGAPTEGDAGEARAEGAAPAALPPRRSKRSLFG